MKHIFLITLLVITSITSVNSQNCDDCVFDNQISINIDDNGNVYASSNISAQAYYWDICQGTSTIIGSNTNQTIQISCNSQSTLKLTRFKDGECSVSCIILCNGGCCEPTFDAFYICDAKKGHGAITPYIDGCPINTISSIEWDLGGAQWTSGPLAGQSSGTMYPPYNQYPKNIGNLDCNWNGQLIITATYYFNNGCPPYTLSQNIELDSPLINTKLSLNKNNSTLEFKNTDLENYRFELYDLTGNLVIEKDAIIQAISIDNYKKGIYIYKLTSKSGKVETGKLLIE